MQDVPHDAPDSLGDLRAGVETATRFLGALFDESDLVLFRPIEVWDENGRKCSHVDYGNTCYRSLTSAPLESTLKQLLLRSAHKHLNLFFGTCPRIGPKGKYDQAWQIRNVRALWVDIDHISVEQALARVAQAGLPQPSIVVNSGSGVHAYWLLEQPYLIDDVVDPLPVETDWIEKPDGGKKTRKYIVENGDKIFLDPQKSASRLSQKAHYIQNVLAGIAKAVGGDHTADLSRLLRLPGSMNRKDQRNGRAPLPTTLVECDADRRYALAAFDAFKPVTAASERARQIAAMPLPQVRNVTASKADKLAELVAACGIAVNGSRSEADFAVCCYAVRHGIAKDDVWRQVEQVGKFAEQGARYFDVTWENAQQHVRAATLDKLQKQNAPKAAAVIDGMNAGFGGRDVQLVDAEGQGGGRPTIEICTATMPVADTLHQVTDRLLSAGNCFLRAEQLVVINNQQILPILSSPELAGLLNQHVEFYFVADEAGEYKPLPPAYANTWLHQHAEQSRLPVIRLFTRNPVYTEDWRVIAPGFDAQSGIYNSGPIVAPRSGTDCLDALLKEFCFQSPADRTNYIGVLLTILLVPRFIGSKPAVLFSGNQPGLGKSILAQLISIIRDGTPAETASYNPNDEEFEKRLGAIVRRGATTIIIDNAKSRGRNPCIDSACLERSITDAVLSFRLLGYSESIRAENSHIFCITANSPEVSRDLVTRSVLVGLYHEGDPARRQFSIADPEGFAQDHRLEVLGELIGMVERWKAAGMPMAHVHSRFNKRGWGNIVGGILEACGEPDFLANADAAAANLDETHREFGELVGVLAEHAQGVWLPGELVELCHRHNLLSADLGEGSARSQATRMGTVAGRFVNERFPLLNGREAVLRKSSDRRGNMYRVAVEGESANL